MSGLKNSISKKLHSLNTCRIGIGLVVFLFILGCNIEGPEWKLSKILVKNNYDGSRIFYKLSYDENGTFTSFSEQHLDQGDQAVRIFGLHYISGKPDSISISGADDNSQLGYFLFSSKGKKQVIKKFYILKDDSIGPKAYLEYEMHIHSIDQRDTIIKVTSTYSDTTFVTRAAKGMRLSKPGSGEHYYFAYGLSDKVKNPFSSAFPEGLTYVIADWLPFSLLDRQATKMVRELNSDKWMSGLSYDIRDGYLFKMDIQFDSFMHRGRLGNDLFLNENRLSSSVTFSYIAN